MIDTYWTTDNRNRLFKEEWINKLFIDQREQNQRIEQMMKELNHDRYKALFVYNEYPNEQTTFLEEVRQILYGKKK